jgi:hypothetical protein
LNEPARKKREEVKGKKVCMIGKNKVRKKYWIIAKLLKYGGQNLKRRGNIF